MHKLCGDHTLIDFHKTFFIRMLLSIVSYLQHTVLLILGDQIQYSPKQR